MHVAIVGCSHGEVDKIYEVIEEIEKRREIKVELVLCCGDFQSVRNMTDLRCMACPIKYQAMHDFHRYYSGEKQAPIPTIFIGGNHEASNYLQELPFGGWVASNIFYCGNANVLRFGNLRIAGISGIYKGNDYLKGRHECPPYDQSTMRSVYHYRNLDIFRLKQITGNIDVMLSHDWPKGIHNYGDLDQLLRRKPFFREEIEQNELGSRPLEDVLQTLKPSYWFSAHLHVKFPALVTFSGGNNGDKASACPEERDEDEVEPKTCSFLALDKVLPRRQFLQVIEVPNADSVREPPKLCYDPQWLAVLRSTDTLLHSRNSLCYMPNDKYKDRFNFTPTESELAEVQRLFEGKFDVPDNFCITAPCFQEGEQPKRASPLVNPQTQSFCQKLGIRDPISVLKGISQDDVEGRMSYDSECSFVDESQLNITCNENSYSQLSLNPDEISLDDDDAIPDPSAGGDDGSCIDHNLVQSPSMTESKFKLNLPTPSKTLPEGLLEESHSDSTPCGKKEMDILKSIFGSEFSVTTEPTSEGPSESSLPFAIDRAGEPQLKKRRNASIYNTAEED